VSAWEVIRVFSIEVLAGPLSFAREVIRIFQVTPWPIRQR